VVSQGISLFSNFNCFAHDYLQTDYSYTVQPRRKTQNPQYYRGQNQQFADRRSDSMWTMIVDKFYHFYHHRGIMLERKSVVMSRTMNNYIFVQCTL
jgi:hypothetical protein